METGSLLAEEYFFFRRNPYNNATNREETIKIIIFKATFSAARSECGSIGMNLLSLDSAQKNKCFTNMTNSIHLILNIHHTKKMTLKLH